MKRISGSTRSATGKSWNRALVPALVLAPVEGDLLARTMPEALHQRLAGSSTRARVAIARSFGPTASMKRISGSTRSATGKSWNRALVP
jgi:exopolysaccharide production protein ExoQ